MSLIGTLNEIKLADVIRLFASTHKTGTLKVLAPDCEAVLGLREGTIVYASAGALAGDEAVLDLFGWKDGQLAFVADEAEALPNVTRGVDALILEGYTLHRAQELIPNDQVVFQAAQRPIGADVRYSIGPEEWRVIRLVDGVRNVREIATSARLRRPDVLRILCELNDAGFLERVEMHKTLRAQLQPPFASFSLLAPGVEADEVAELDEGLSQDWRKAQRFSRGVERIKVRSLNGKSVRLTVSFRPGTGRDIYLSRPALMKLGVREGDAVTVRPIGSRLRESSA
jgi:hypothetical protein